MMLAQCVVAAEMLAIEKYLRRFLIAMLLLVSLVGFLRCEMMVRDLVAIALE